MLREDEDFVEARRNRAPGKIISIADFLVKKKPQNVSQKAWKNSFSVLSQDDDVCVARPSCDRLLNKTLLPFSVHNNFHNELINTAITDNRATVRGDRQWPHVDSPGVKPPNVHTVLKEAEPPRCNRRPNDATVISRRRSQVKPTFPKLWEHMLRWL